MASALEALHEHDTKIVQELIESTVRSTLINLGIDPSNPIEAQKDAAFLRELRTGIQTSKRQIFALLVASLFAAIGAAVAFWFQAGGGPKP